MDSKGDIKDWLIDEMPPGDDSLDVYMEAARVEFGERWHPKFEKYVMDAWREARLSEESTLEEISEVASETGESFYSRRIAEITGIKRSTLWSRFKRLMLGE